ncbi:hypothetical protein [Mucilaginibacter paludis]|uniref:Uncharacterized protein n=1 Tax=Mucilaginibacter paludis DSM 18603 TaxID=714943 RepID=H1Y3L0_9SPHI|nr:hypothetical protein [Mucilaginibacter paludis]EHQ29778.1 hypothetical protein Mucpa_5709 [Mucilaginibacter paludis DSM 18603]
MSKNAKSPKEQVSHYGKKLYYVNPSLIVQKPKPDKSEPQFLFEDVEDDHDK